MRHKGLVIIAAALLLFPARVEASELSIIDKGWLMLIAQAEAEGEGVEGKAAVMQVVMNRVEDERFPGTIAEVIFEKNQFSTANEGGRLWKAQPDAECFEAVELIENGWNKAEGALYFNSCNQTAGAFLFKMGNHKFYK